MKKTIAILSITAFCIMGIAWAATEQESINVNYANKTATEVFQDGSFAVTNSILVNGDKVQNNAFVPDGASQTVEITGNAFTQIVGALRSAGAINQDAITNATIGKTGVYTADSDETQTNYWANGTY